jgi:hypothetical protein
MQFKLTATSFASEAGDGMDKFFVTVLIGLSRVIATIILAYFILDKYGRRPPSIFSGLGEMKNLKPQAWANVIFQRKILFTF